MRAQFSGALCPGKAIQATEGDDLGFSCISDDFGLFLVFYQFVTMQA